MNNILHYRVMFLWYYQVIAISYIKQKCAKLRASSAFVSYVPEVLTCLTCLRALRAGVTTCLLFFTCLNCLPFLRAWRAFSFFASSVPSFFTCLHFIYILLLFLYAFIFLGAFIFMKFFKLFTYLAFLHFLHDLRCFIFPLKYQIKEGRGNWFFSRLLREPSGLISGF